MTQKVIKIGSSAGITIPKKQLEELGISIGDEIIVDIKPTKKSLQKIATELDSFMDEYADDLKNLARR